MNLVAAIASGLLSGVFAVSAGLKLRDRAQARDAMSTFGFPGATADAVAYIEGFTALGLVAERRTAWSALVALVLLIGFTGVLALKLARGDSTPCPCFGANSDAATSTSIVRNLVLIAMAVLATYPRGQASLLAIAVAVLATGVFWIRQR